MASSGPASLSRGLNTKPSRSFVKRFDPLKQQKSVGDETEQTADETTSSDTSEMFAKEFVVSNNLQTFDDDCNPFGGLIQPSLDPEIATPSPTTQRLRPTRSRSRSAAPPTSRNRRRGTSVQPSGRRSPSPSKRRMNDGLLYTNEASLRNVVSEFEVKPSKVLPVASCVLAPVERKSPRPRGRRAFSRKNVALKADHEEDQSESFSVSYSQPNREEFGSSRSAVNKPEEYTIMPSRRKCDASVVSYSSKTTCSSSTRESSPRRRTDATRRHPVRNPSNRGRSKSPRHQVDVQFVPPNQDREEHNHERPRVRSPRRSGRRHLTTPTPPPGPPPSSTPQSSICKTPRSQSSSTSSRKHLSPNKPRRKDLCSPDKQSRKRMTSPSKYMHKETRSPRSPTKSRSSSRALERPQLQTESRSRDLSRRRVSMSSKTPRGSSRRDLERKHSSLRMSRGSMSTSFHGFDMPSARAKSLRSMKSHQNLSMSCRTLDMSSPSSKSSRNVKTARHLSKSRGRSQRSLNTDSRHRFRDAETTQVEDVCPDSPDYRKNRVVRLHHGESATERLSRVSSQVQHSTRPHSSRQPSALRLSQPSPIFDDFSAPEFF